MRSITLLVYCGSFLVSLAACSDSKPSGPSSNADKGGATSKGGTTDEGGLGGANAGSSGEESPAGASAGADSNLIASLANVPTAIAADAANVYWIATGEGIQARAVTGGPVSTLTRVTQLSDGLAVSPTTLAWRQGSGTNADGDLVNSLVSLPVGGGKPTVVAVAGTTSFALTATDIFWVVPTPLSKVSLGMTDGSVFKAGVDGADTQTLIDGLVNVGGLAVDDSNAYFVDGKTINRLSLSDGAVTPLVSDLHGSVRIALDAKNLYFETNDAISKLSLDGGAPQVLASGLQLADQFAVSETDVYWMQAQTVSLTARATIFKVAIDGGDPATVVEEAADLPGFGLSPAGIYYYSFDAKAIVGAPL